MSVDASQTGPVLVLIPVFNDWEAVSRLLVLLDGALAKANRRADVLLLDDASTMELPQERFEALGPLRALDQVEVLTLKRNLGHQRAIAVGLAYIENERNCSMAVLMDGDGEDNPEDVPRLLDRCEREGGRKIVFAERAKRSESWAFRVNYGCYRLLHRILAGPAARVGNFSVIPRERLSSLAVVSELWSHYAAAVVQSRQPYCLEPTQRAKRLQGRSTMNFVKLVVHGLSAIAVYSETVGVRLLTASFALVICTAIGLGLVLYLRLATPLAIPGWATSALGILGILLVLGVMFSFLFSFMILGGRSVLGFLPRRDYSYFVGPIRSLTPQSRS